MPILIQLYILFWGTLTFIAFVLIIKNYKNMIVFQKAYVFFLFKTWKIVLLLLAIIGFCYISTLWYDPSWDIPETIIMSLLTFYFSPYTVWVWYRFYKWISRSKAELYISIILMFFIACWFYDVYAMIFLMGEYPPMAFANLGLSPFFYTTWGMMWSLDYSKKSWVVFVYTQKEWIVFTWDKNIFWKVFLYAFPIIFFIAFIFWYFIYDNM